MAEDTNPPSKSPRPEPWYRLKYERTRRRVLADTSERSAKFKIFELVAAFVTMRRLEAGIDARRYRLEAHTFEIQTLQGLLFWIRGRNPAVDRARDTIILIAKGDPEGERTVDEALETLLEDNKRSFREEQRSWATLPRSERTHPLDEYIDEVLKEDPNISADRLLRRIQKDEHAEGHPADYIQEVTAIEIFAVDPKTGEKGKPVKVGGLRSRLSRRKNL